MPATPITPAAQYLRMSTDHQHLSLAYQAAAIRRYADNHGFQIVQSYEDPGRSGLTLKHREGLSRLLQDVFCGRQVYKVILVYDVSRWGRFQDTDEAAHYEFICKNAGIPVHYCAETFDNDGTPPNAIMKTLRRVMAGEYSRELSVRLRRAKELIAKDGNWNGGPAPYGLRRRLISDDGRPGQFLKPGEVKSVAGGRVVLVPGCAKEVSRVREIYRLTIMEGRSAKSIAGEFNRRHSKCHGRQWTYGQILAILGNPKYAGCATWGRSTGILGVKRIPAPREQWTLKPGAFDAIVDEETFEAAQKVLSNRTRNKSNEDLLEGLRALLRHEGRLSQDLISTSRGVPGVSTYAHRFGSLRRAYEMIGYRVFENRAQVWRTRRLTLKIQTELCRRILTTFRGEVTLVQRKPGTFRKMLRFRDGLNVSVLVCPCLKTALGKYRWCVPVIPSERNYVTLVCRRTADNAAFMDFYVVPNVDRPRLFRIKQDDQWLRRGKRLIDLSRLRRVAALLCYGPGQVGVSAPCPAIK